MVTEPSFSLSCSPIMEAISKVRPKAAVATGTCGGFLGRDLQGRAPEWPWQQWRVFGNHSYNIVHVIPLFLFRCLRFACGKKDPFFPITGRTEFPISILSDLGKANLLQIRGEFLRGIGLFLVDFRFARPH